MASSRIMVFGIVVVCACLSVSLAHHDTTTAKQKMEQYKIVPDVIPVAPPTTAEVDYGNGTSLHLGNSLTPSQVKRKPQSVNWQAETGFLYTLLMMDPDAPSRQNNSLAQVKHWLVVNIAANDINQGEEIAGYRGSGPPKGTGFHRYIFLVFKQPGRIEVTEKKVPSSSRENRYNWNSTSFASQYNLGNPIAGNFFQAEWDPYVDSIPK